MSQPIIPDDLLRMMQAYEKRIDRLERAAVSSVTRGPWAQLPVSAAAGAAYFAYDRWGGTLYVSDGDTWQVASQNGIVYQTNGTTNIFGTGSVLNSDSDGGYIIDYDVGLALAVNQLAGNFFVQPNGDTNPAHYENERHRHWFDGTATGQDVQRGGNSGSQKGLLLGVSEWNVGGRLVGHAVIGGKVSAMTGGGERLVAAQYTFVPTGPGLKNIGGVVSGYWTDYQAVITSLRFEAEYCSNFSGTIRIRPINPT